MKNNRPNFSNIRNAVVLGSGVMGSRIACHFANAGLDVLLLDRAFPGSEGKSAGERNRIATESLEQAVKSKPSPLFLPALSSRIRTGNLEDNLHEIVGYDWIIEAIVEDPAIKISLYEQVEKFRRKGSIVSSNTSGIPLKLLSKGRSEDFNQHFCGTHFFNPPRYLPLLEIIPGPSTNASVLQLLQDFGTRMLGKTTILCKDTPAFIANRIGVFSMLDTVNTSIRHGISIEETDKLTGPVIGHPKSATFRTADVVGLDTLLKVADGLNSALKNSELEIPVQLRKMQENNWLGDKSGQGFYRKVTGADGKKEFQSLNLSTLEYGSSAKTNLAALEKTKEVANLRDRWKILISGEDKTARFYRETLGNLFWYAASCIPEIADDCSQIDAAVEAGFGWEAGPFRCWQQLGFREGFELAKNSGREIPAWLIELSKLEEPRFYKSSGDLQTEWSISKKEYLPVQYSQGSIDLNELRKRHTIFSNEGASIHDLGDGIACLEFHSKMNTLGSEVVDALNKAFDLAELSFRGLVIGNQGANFSAGANLGLVFMYAMEQEFDEIDFMVRHFQNTVMRVRYSGIPVVLAPHGLSLGGACELSLHADGIQAAAETYMGLVEAGVGLIPAGGGTKEMARRVSAGFQNGDPELNRMQNAFMNMAMAKVSESALQAFELGYFRSGDRISMNRKLQLSDAKSLAINLADNGYIKPVPSKDIRVNGRAGMANLMAGIHAMEAAGKISGHDRNVAEKLNYVLNGGDLTYPQLVSEQYILDLEREAFLSLCGERKTLERMQSLLTGGKVLRN